MQSEYTITVPECQDVVENILDDRTAAGRVRPWAEQKAAAMRLAEKYEYIDHDKAERVRECATWLKFRRTEGGLKLALANFCRVRLCPVCQWRRSLKIYGQMSRICEALPDDYAIIALNLTLRNCESRLIGKTLDKLLGGFSRLIKYKDVAAVVQGTYRATEITINRDPHSAWFGTLHPHLHTLLVVRKSYFHSMKYISAARWAELWQRAAGTDYTPDISVYRLKVKDGQSITDALREVTKYTVKASDLCDDEIPADVLADLDAALIKRRFMGLGGILRDLHKQLNLSDMEDDGDLVHVGDGDDLTEEQRQDIYYIWRSGVYVEWGGDNSD